MFNSDFYPTPEPLIKKILEKIQCKETWGDRFSPAKKC